MVKTPGARRVGGRRLPPLRTRDLWPLLAMQGHLSTFSGPGIQPFPDPLNDYSVTGIFTLYPTNFMKNEVVRHALKSLPSTYKLIYSHTIPHLFASSLRRGTCFPLFKLVHLPVTMVPFLCASPGTLFHGMYRPSISFSISDYFSLPAPSPHPINMLKCLFKTNCSVSLLPL